EAGVTNGHWHLNSKDVAVNEKIFVGMGGKAFQAGGRHRVLFPGVMDHTRRGSRIANPPDARVGGQPRRLCRRQWAGACCPVESSRCAGLTAGWISGVAALAEIAT